MSPPGFANLIALAIFAVWLYGTVALVGRLSGYVITLLGELFGLAVPIIHMQGAEGPIVAITGCPPRLTERPLSDLRRRFAPHDS